MRRWVQYGVLSAALLLSACATTQSPSDSDGSYWSQRQGVSTQLLVMLKDQPLAHYAPGYSDAVIYDPHALGPALRATELALARRFHLRLIDHWPMPSLGVHCFLEQVQAGEPPELVVQGLREHPLVESVQPMRTFHLLGGPSSVDRQALAHHAPAELLSLATHDAQGLSGWAQMERIHQWATGRGVLLAQIDTGVEATHPNLTRQLMPMVDLVGGSRGAAEWHGTAVAGIMVARDDGPRGMVGVAPGARLLPLRACWQEVSGASTGVCTSFTLAKAIQYAIQHEAKVINLSLSGPSDALLTRLIDKAVALGIVVVAAADPQVQDGGFPANHDGVVAVSRIGDRCGPRAVLAPGDHLLTTTPPDAWAFVSGSSFASAQISGLIALALEASPSLTPTRVMALLRSYSTPGWATAVQTGVNACAMMAGLSRAAACACCDQAPVVQRMSQDASW